MNPVATLHAIRRFLSSSPRDYDFPLGGEVAIPIDAERDLLTALPASVSVELLGMIRPTIQRQDAYTLVIFAVRMAVFAARTKDPIPIKKSLWLLCVDDNEVDWRDVLVALAIIEDCSTNSGTDFRNSLEEVADLAPHRRQHTLREGYLGRTPEMRAVETFGYQVLHPGSEAMTYVRRN